MRAVVPGSTGRGSDLMIEDFFFRMNPARVHFGQGTMGLVGEEVAALGAKRVAILSTPEQRDLADRIALSLGGAAAGVFAEARMHTPVDLTEQLLVRIRAEGVDCLVAAGGGSTVGLAKALTLRSGLPIIAVPTTYAGSEMTPILGQTAEGEKTTLADQSVLPVSVIYDVDLTLSLPVQMSVTSGINAMAHSVEALYARDGNPIVTLMASQSISSLAEGLRSIAVDAGDIAGRRQVLYGAWLAGMCLGLVGMSLHHKLCHVLGGSFDLPHAATHAVVLPYAVAYNRDAAPSAMHHLAAALKTSDPVSGLFELVHELGAPLSLAAIGMPADGIERAAELAVRNPYWNPRPVERESLRNLISRAHAGAGI